MKGREKTAESVADIYVASLTLAFGQDGRSLYYVA
jgi:hypothetical protein